MRQHKGQVRNSENTKQKKWNDKSNEAAGSKAVTTLMDIKRRAAIWGGFGKWRDTNEIVCRSGLGPFHQRVAVVSVKYGPSHKADCRVVDDIQTFGGWRINNISIVKYREDWEFDQELFLLWWRKPILDLWWHNVYMCVSNVQPDSRVFVVANGTDLGAFQGVDLKWTRNLRQISKKNHTFCFSECSEPRGDQRKRAECY